MAKKKSAKQAGKIKRIVIDLKEDEHKTLQEAANADLMPVKGAGRKYLLLGLSMLSGSHGKPAYQSEADQKIAEMPF